MPVADLNEEELPKRLDKETINELPLIRFHGAIQVAEDAKSFNRYASRLKKQRVLGLVLLAAVLLDMLKKRGWRLTSQT